MSKPTGYGGRDGPDWGVSSLYNTKAVISDLSEVAVRLGSIVNFDRTGTVLYYDDFKAGLTNWENNSNPVGAYAVATARFCSITPYAIKLQTTSDAASYSGIKRGLPFPYVSRMGFEFHYKQIADINRMMLNLYIYTGTYLYIVDMELKQETDEILLADENGIDHVISDYNLVQVTYSPFHVFKIVFDLTTEYHQRMVIDDVDYDISDIGIRKLSNTTDAHMYILFYLWSTGSNARSCYIDNVIVTIDEPQ